MRFTAGMAVGMTLVIIAWTRGAWILGRILTTPGDIDYNGGTRWPPRP